MAEDPSWRILQGWNGLLELTLGTQGSLSANRGILQFRSRPRPTIQIK